MHMHVKGDALQDARDAFLKGCGPDAVEDVQRRGSQRMYRSLAWFEIVQDKVRNFVSQRETTVVFFIGSIEDNDASSMPRDQTSTKWSVWTGKSHRQAFVS